jgi:TIR domain
VSGGVFISYRREDARGVAGRIYDRLSDRLGSENVFFDVDNIAPGLDFVEVLSERVGACDALVAIIGKGWLASADTDGGRRLDREDDFVRIEIEAALKRGVPVIPVLVEDATMPRSVDLPESLRKLARRQGVTIDHARFNSDVERLIRVLSAIEEDAQRPKSEAEAAPPRDAPPAKRANASRGGARRLVATLALTGAVILALGAFLALRSRAPEPAPASADLARPSASASLDPSPAQTDPPAAAAPPLLADPSALLGLSGALLKTPNAAVDAPVSADTLAREIAEQKDLQDKTQQKLDELARAGNAAVKHIGTDPDPTAATQTANAAANAAAPAADAQQWLSRADFRAEVGKQWAAGNYPDASWARCQNGASQAGAHWSARPAGQRFSFSALDDKNFAAEKAKLLAQGYAVQYDNRFQDCDRATHHLGLWMKAE